MTLDPPTFSKFASIEPALPKDIERSLVIDESSALCVPRSEYFIVVLLLCLGEGPRCFRCCTTSELLIVFLEELLQGQSTKLLRRKWEQRNCMDVGTRHIDEHERVPHHLEARVDEIGRLGEKWC